MAKAKEEKVEASKKTIAKKVTTTKTVKKVVKKPSAKPAKEVKDKVILENDQKIDSIAQEPEEIITEEPLAKAGKHSAKGLKEQEEKQAKIEQQLHRDEEEAKATADSAPKKTVKPARSKLERSGKKFREAAKLIEKDKEYSLKEGVALAVKTSPTKFDATVELHVNLNVDPKQADQNIRDTVVLPGGTGKTLRIAVLAEAADIAKAKAAGATIAGGDDFLQQLDKEKLDFDVLIATPAMMPKLGKYARLLGPKGLMPSPKSGTVTPDVTKAVTEAKAGKVEYRVDSTGIVHLGVGKVSFGADKLEQNTKAVLGSIKSAKPASIKGIYVHSIHLTTTMGPSIKLLISEV